MADNEVELAKAVHERMMIAEYSNKFDGEFKLVGLQIPLIKGLIYQKEQDILAQLRDLTDVDSTTTLMSPQASLAIARQEGMIEVLYQLIEQSELPDDESGE